jgi:hypothetical protein
LVSGEFNGERATGFVDRGGKFNPIEGFVADQKGGSGGGGTGVFKTEAVNTPQGPKLLITRKDGTQELTAFTPTATTLGQGRLAVAQERIAPDAAGTLAGAKAFSAARGKGVGAEDANRLNQQRPLTDVDLQELSIVSGLEDSQFDRSIAALDNVLENADGFTTGVLGAVGRLIPGSPAFDLSVALSPVTSNEQIGGLKEARDNSKDGSSGFGQLTQNELAILATRRADVNQSASEGEFRRNVELLREATIEVNEARKARISNARNRGRGAPTQPAQGRGAQPQPAQGRTVVQNGVTFVQDANGNFIPQGN